MNKKYNLNAASLFGFPKNGPIGSEANQLYTSQQKAIALLELQIQAHIGRKALEGERILQCSGNHRDKYSMSFWAKTDTQPGEIEYDQNYELLIAPNERKVEINVFSVRGSKVMALSIDIPGEIIGSGLSSEINKGKNYRGLFFSTEPGERSANLFDLTKLIAKSIVMVKSYLAAEMAEEKAITNENDDDNGMSMG